MAGHPSRPPRGDSPCCTAPPADPPSLLPALLAPPAPPCPQVQQERMGALVAHVLERQDTLAAEVKALRRQLAGLLQARDSFLWL